MSRHKNYKALTSRFQKPLILLVVMFVLTLMNPGIFLYGPSSRTQGCQPVH